MFEDYKRMMNESWQARFAGIMIPVYGITMLISIIFLTKSWLYIWIVSPVSIGLLVSMLLLIISRHKEEEKHYNSKNK